MNLTISRLYYLKDLPDIYLLFRCSLSFMDSAIENCKHSDDKLSNLPADLIYRILSFVNTPEVVGTSLLSRKWRYIWTSVPVLNFDFDGFRDLEQFQELSYDECLSTFWEIVRRTLIIRDAPPVNRLHFKCDYSDTEPLNLLLRLCAMRNVKELELVAVSTLQIRRLSRDFVESALAMTQNFNGLANLQPPMVFGNLKSLRLVRIQFVDAEITEKLFSDCGALEDLSIEYCCFLMMKVLNISSRKLQKLTFVNMGPTNRSMSALIFRSRLTVNTPNLVSFYYSGPAPRFSEFSDMPTLNHVCIQIVNIGWSTILLRPMSATAMVSGFDYAKVLSVSSSWVLYFSPTYSWLFPGGVTFHRLWFLKLEFFCNELHMEGLINLLKVSPNLKSLCIKFRKWPGTIIWESRDENVPCFSQHFKKLKITKFYDSAFSMEFIKFFLQNGKSLEKIIINQKKQQVDPQKLYALQSVEVASKEVSVSVELLSAYGKTELLQFAYKKRRVGLWRRFQEKESKSKRSMSDAARKSGGSFRYNKKRHLCDTSNSIASSKKKLRRSM